MGMIDDEAQDMEAVAWRAGLIPPSSKNKGRWDWCMLALVLYTSITVPFTLVFYPFTDFDTSYVGFGVDCLVDIFYIADIFVSMRTTYYDRDGVLVLDRSRARKRYLKTWFLLDAFASFPYEHAANAICMGWPDVEVPASLKLPSLAKLFRMWRLGPKVTRLSTSKVFQIGQLTCILLMVAHWYACLWFWMGESAAPDGGVVDLMPGADGTSWVYRLDLEDETRTMKYLSALYWAVTTLMKSPWFHPNSPEEFVGATLMIIFGCVLFAYFIGNVTAVITAANATAGRYRGQVGQLKSFCTAHKLSAKLTSKLLVYNDALWSETFGGIDRNAMIRRVPPHLLPQVTIEMYRPLLDACPFLFDCTASGCAHFLQALVVRVCDRGDVLLRAGSLALTMYILHRGEVKIDYDPSAPKQTAEFYVPGGRIGGPKKKVLSERSSTKDAMRGRTDKFGTLLGWRDPFQEGRVAIDYSVTALCRCSLLSITRSELRALLVTYSEDREHFHKAIEHAQNSAKGGTGRSSVRRRSESDKDGGQGRESCRDTAELSASGSSTEGADCPANGKNGLSVGGLAGETAPGVDADGATSGAAAAGASSVELAGLRGEVAALTKLVQAQSKMFQKMMEQGQCGGGTTQDELESWSHEVLG